MRFNLNWKWNIVFLWLVVAASFSTLELYKLHSEMERRGDYELHNAHIPVVNRAIAFLESSLALHEIQNSGNPEDAEDHLQDNGEEF